jgi:4-amino-4-deoxy-L-arabinose transferase-like glycosyltransferase
MSKIKKHGRKTKQSKPGLTETVRIFFDRHEKTFASLSITAGTLISILLFDPKVSLSGDDCDYIVNAGNFWKNFIYPGHHGPLYPIVLSPFVGLFGIKLTLLKSLSVIFMITSFWLFYKSFRHTVSSIILIPALFLVCINPHVLFFASYTYSEPLFMLIQALFFYLFSRYFRNSDTEQTLSSISRDWRKYLIPAFVIMGMGLTRTIGFCVIGAVILYFTIERRWKDLIFITGFWGVLFGIFYFLKPLIWPDSASVQSFEMLLAKNPYQLEQGPEDIPGLINRVTGNSHIYLSGFLYRYLGLRSDFPIKDIPVLSVFTYMLFIICLVTLFKKNKSLFFTGLYTGILLFASFVLLHTLWSQDRIIMIYYPYILLFLLGGIYYLLKNKSLRNFAWIYPLTVVALFIGTGKHLKAKVEQNMPVLQQNLSGNDLYGLTPDWENFIRMSRWANDNLDKNAVIVSRKPSISYVYTGREFQGMYNVPGEILSNVTAHIEKEKDENVFLITDISKKRNPGLAPFIQYVLVTKENGNFRIGNESVSSAGIYQIPKSLFDEKLINLLDSLDVNYTSDHETFIQQYIDDKAQNYMIMSPDMLLKGLRDANVRYLLLPKIRLYTPQNTGRFITTVHHYIRYIQMKYPDSFLLIHTIGKEETCELVEFTGQ